MKRDDEILVIKVTDWKPNNARMQQRIAGWWKINPTRLQNVNIAMVIYQNRIVQEYAIGDEIIYNRSLQRVRLHLQTLSQHTKLWQRTVHYGTHNPATVCTFDKLCNSLDKKEVR